MTHIIDTLCSSLEVLGWTQRPRGEGVSLSNHLYFNGLLVEEDKNIAGDNDNAGA